MRAFTKIAAVAALLLAPIGASASTMSATLDFDTANSLFEFDTDQASGNVSIVNGNCLSGSCLSVRASNGGETVTMSRNDGGTFSVTGLWFQLLGNGNDGNTLSIASNLGAVADFAVPTYLHNVGYTVSLTTGMITSLSFTNVNRGGVRIDGIQASYDMAPVPLPATGLLLLAGVGGLAVMRRRRRAA